MIFPRREEATNKDLILTIIEIQGFLSRYGRLHTNWHETLNEVIARLEQEPKQGHWITWKEAGNEIPSETRFECSVCHDAAQTLCNGLDLLSPYCPNCGAKMSEVSE